MFSHCSLIDLAVFKPSALHSRLSFAQAAHPPAPDEDEAAQTARLEALAAAIEAAKAQVHQARPPGFWPSSETKTDIAPTSKKVVVGFSFSAMRHSSPFFSLATHD